MTSAVNWTLLGLVIARPSYGLELARRFERSYDGVLAVSSASHVYAALDVLEERGLIETIPGPEGGRQPKPHYRATSLGLGGYEDWLVEQAEADAQRQELWVRQLAVFAHNPEAALRVIDRSERVYLRTRAAKAGAMDRGAGDRQGTLVDWLVAEQERITVGGKLSWWNAARRRFEAIAGRQGGDGSA